MYMPIHAKSYFNMKESLSVQTTKKCSFLILASTLCLLVMLLSACGSSTTPGGGSTSGSLKPGVASLDKQILRESMGDSDFLSLDPALNQVAQNVTPAVFTGLVQINDDGNVVDQMAASHQVSTDGLTYTFTLKPNLKFSDGSPLTADDVVYSINRA